MYCILLPFSKEFNYKMFWVFVSYLLCIVPESLEFLFIFFTFMSLFVMLDASLDIYPSSVVHIGVRAKPQKLREALWAMLALDSW